MLKLLLIALLMLPMKNTQAQNRTEGLHLLAGPSMSLIELEGQAFSEEKFVGLGFSTAGVYQRGPLIFGMKSTANIGAHNNDEDEILNSQGSTPLRRYIQHVSFVPFVGMRWPSQEWPFDFQVELGLVRAMTSIKHKDDYNDEYQRKIRKSTFESRGLDWTLGILPHGMFGNLFLALNLEVLRSEKQYFVDVTQMKNALTLARSRSEDVKGISSYSLTLSTYLF